LFEQNIFKQFLVEKNTFKCCMHVNLMCVLCAADSGRDVELQFLHWTAFPDHDGTHRACCWS